MDHFALPGDALAAAKRQGRLHRNFQGYSTQPDCDLIGLGVSAIGRMGATYSQNAKTLPEYYDAVRQGQFPIVRGLALTRDDLLRRAVIMALMCQGRLEFESIELSHLIKVPEYFKSELESLAPYEAMGLVVREPGALQVTARGGSSFAPSPWRLTSTFRQIGSGSVSRASSEGELCVDLQCPDDGAGRHGPLRGHVRCFQCRRGRGLRRWAFRLGRLSPGAGAGYAAAGAVASSVSALGELGQLSPALRPLWGLAHMAALALGIWLLLTGRQPAWLDRLGRGATLHRHVGRLAACGAGQGPGRWRVVGGLALRAASIGPGRGGLGQWAVGRCR
jgi:hypothetical protein